MKKLSTFINEAKGGKLFDLHPSKLKTGKDFYWYDEEEKDKILAIYKNAEDFLSAAKKNKYDTETVENAMENDDYNGEYIIVAKSNKMGIVYRPTESDPYSRVIDVDFDPEDYE